MRRVADTARACTSAELGRQRNWVVACFLHTEWPVGTPALSAFLVDTPTLKAFGAHDTVADKSAVTLIAADVPIASTNALNVMTVKAWVTYLNCHTIRVSSRRRTPGVAMTAVSEVSGNEQCRDLFGLKQRRHPSRGGEAQGIDGESFARIWHLFFLPF